jgi:hypothetical protein
VILDLKMPMRGLPKGPCSELLAEVWPDVARRARLRGLWNSLAWRREIELALVSVHKVYFFCRYCYTSGSIIIIGLST